MKHRTQTQPKLICISNLGVFV